VTSPANEEAAINATTQGSFARNESFLKLLTTQQG
jgi:hypothetical protein